MINLNIDWAKQVAILVDTEKPLGKLIFEIQINQLFFKGVDLMFILRDDQTANISIKAVDAKGFDTTFQTITYSSSDETVATVMAGVITAVKPGKATINVVADADLGVGVTQLVGTLDVQVVAGEAVSLGVTGVIISPVVVAPVVAPVVAEPAPVAVEPAPLAALPVVEPVVVPPVVEIPALVVDPSAPVTSPVTEPVPVTAGVSNSPDASIAPAPTV